MTNNNARTSVNRTVILVIYFSEVYAKKNAPIPPWQKEFTLILRSVPRIGIFASILAALQLWQYPERNIFVTSIIPPKYVPAWGWTTLIVVGGFSVFVYGTYTCVTLFIQVIALFMYVSNFLLSEQR